MKHFTTRAAALALALLFAFPLSACGKKGRPSAGIDPVETPMPTPTAEPTPEPEPTTPPVPLVAWPTTAVVEHLFFHPVIAYPKWAFHDCPSSQSQKEGLDDWMVTVDEYNKILQSVYDNGYVLVNMNDVWSEYTTDSGQTRMRRNTLMVPEGKKPLVISFDDTNYYEYMLEEGFTSKLVLGDDGNIWAECTDPYTGETFLTQDLDAITILDKFVAEHPDFSMNGVKGCLSLTGYQGILGYRTQTNTDDTSAAFEANRQKEIAAVKPIVQRLKETGWYFGSHTWGHVNLSTWSLDKVKRDTQRWADEVGSLVGPTQILFYPHGARPDGDHDQGEPGPMFQYLHSQGFRIFASVGINSYEKCKTEISAVICDRLHPDGTTLRSGKSLSRYSQFYDAKEIIDLDVRPNLGVTW
ncbi:polysaccharide deacetylase family protein [Pseudoflavonifractor phocaeensis]|uniref:polysaccharide deacetylase family protein n=1 Tax=Pseudoflavonifractor phocaeensis TaxID=1870988 RepID=UPI00313EE455